MSDGISDSRPIDMHIERWTSLGKHRFRKPVDVFVRHFKGELQIECILLDVEVSMGTYYASTEFIWAEFRKKMMEALKNPATYAKWVHPVTMQELDELREKSQKMRDLFYYPIKAKFDAGDMTITKDMVDLARSDYLTTQKRAEEAVLFWIAQNDYY